MLRGKKGIEERKNILFMKEMEEAGRKVPDVFFRKGRTFRKDFRNRPVFLEGLFQIGQGRNQSLCLSFLVAWLGKKENCAEIGLLRRDAFGFKVHGNKRRRDSFLVFLQGSACQKDLAGIDHRKSVFCVRESMPRVVFGNREESRIIHDFLIICFFPFPSMDDRG